MSIENKNSIENETEVADEAQDQRTTKEAIKENLLFARDVVYTAMGSIGLLAAGLNIISSNQDNYRYSEEDTWNRDQGVAVELAKRFTDCHIESFVDTHTHPQATPRMSHPEDRTTLKLQVSVDKSKDIKTDEYPYNDRDRVQRSSPIVAASISNEANDLAAPELGNIGRPLENNEFGQMTKREGAYPAKLDVEFHPKTNYPDGKQARIFVKTPVTASDKPERRFQATGYMDCGIMVFDGGTRSWKLINNSPSGEPIVKTELQEDPN